MKHSDEPQEKTLDKENNAESELSQSGSPNAQPDNRFSFVDTVRPNPETSTERKDLADVADISVVESITSNGDVIDPPKPRQIVYRQTGSILKQAGSSNVREVKRSTVSWDPRESIQEICTGPRKRLKTSTWPRLRSSSEHTHSSLTIVFYIINSMFLALGFFFIVLGALATLSDSCMATLFNTNWRGGVDSNGFYVLRTASICIMVAGVLMMLVSAMGLFGMYRTNISLLNVYSVLLLLFFLLKVVALGLVYVFEHSLTANITDQLFKAIKANYEGYNSNNPVSQAFDFAHAFFGCCGMRSWTDFRSTAWYDSEHRGHQLKNTTVYSQFPITCCQLKVTPVSMYSCSQLWNGEPPALTDPHCPVRVPSRDNPNTVQPCNKPIKTFLEDQFIAIYYVAMVVFVTELVSFNFARALMDYLHQH